MPLTANQLKIVGLVAVVPLTILVLEFWVELVVIAMLVWLGYAAYAKYQSDELRIKRAAHMTCQHCGTTGSIVASKTRVKEGLDGGKVAGAVLTAGFSIWLTGLSAMRERFGYECTHCGASWAQ